MLQGDDLSVQLFIAAAALNVLSVAITQGGWTHRWFVRTMFGLAVLLAIASIAWRYLEIKIPLIGGALLFAATSRVVWLLSGVVPAFVLGLLVSNLLHRRREGRKDPEVWLTVDKAMEDYVRQDLRDQYRDINSQIEEVAQEQQKLGRRIREMGRTIIYVNEAERSEMATVLAKSVGEQGKCESKAKELRKAFEDCREARRLNINSQLCSGTLVAKGFIAPHEPGKAERVIPTSEWRFLSLDADADQALGPNFGYIALLIGRPKPLSALNLM